jgi:putative DNA primase/helicase
MSDKFDAEKMARTALANAEHARARPQRETQYRSTGGTAADDIDTDDTDEPILAPALSDEALALRFGDQHAHHMRYVAKWGTWLIFDGMRWECDETLKARGIARQICREAANSCNESERIKVLIASRRTITAVEALAQADRRVAATTEKWDRDPWMINTPGGTIDLHTGERWPHDAADYVTKKTAVTPDSHCAIPAWRSFLQRITDGDADLVAFLQCMAGYGLTGCTDEHALFFAFGHGANGKTTFLNAITGIMGDYARPAPIETFTASGNSERHPTDLAACAAPAWCRRSKPKKAGAGRNQRSRH